MGMTTIVYGYIREPRTGCAKVEQMLESNKKQIESLPETDEYPFLVRGLFSFSDVSYRNRLIHFAGGYKQLESYWADWLAKFEALLAQLFWERVRLHLITEWTEEFTYDWAAAATIKDSFRSGSPLPTTIWQHKGGPRDDIGKR
ncbi:MAG: hypothetical protein EHM23_30145 [Acidobacteria bacterium]|nr:MAG: hypothetical protein EHM23_30145 [Acidobacteriota bacterium]